MLNTPIAVGLLSKLSKRTTVYLLVVFQRLLGITEGFHRFLQGTSIDLARAVQFKSTIHDTLVSQRTEQVADELYEVTKQLCSDHNLPEPSPAPRRKQRRMDDFVVEGSTGSGSDLLNDSESLKQGLFFPCIDRMINELGHRFSTVAGELMDGIQACHPASKSFLDLQSLEKLAGPRRGLGGKELPEQEGSRFHPGHPQCLQAPGLYDVPVTEGHLAGGTDYPCQQLQL